MANKVEFVKTAYSTRLSCKNLWIRSLIGKALTNRWEIGDSSSPAQEIVITWKVTEKDTKRANHYRQLSDVKDPFYEW